MIEAAEILRAKVLIVDDLPADVRLLEHVLGGAGYLSVASSLDSRSVCELHRKNHYDLILLDLQMPGMDGFAVMAGLSEIEGDGNLPVVVLTVQPEHKRRALRAGAQDFVNKPFELADLLRRIHRFLEIRLSVQALVLAGLAARSM